MRAKEILKELHLIRSELFSGVGAADIEEHLLEAIRIMNKLIQRLEDRA